MSILDSRDEVTEAQARLKTANAETLSRDLEYWTVAAYDAAEAYRQLHNRIGSVRQLHAEAEGWVGLIAEEIRSRRPGASTSTERTE